MSSFFNKVSEMYPKRQFDPNSKEDLKAYKYFLENYSWGHNGCPFNLEWPWLNVPDMINHKIATSAVAEV